MAKETILDEYIRTHPKSQKLHEKAKELFAADGVTHWCRLFSYYLPYMTHAEGTHLWDVDGNEYIDYVMGHGTLILGHNHPDVLKATQEQLVKGVHYSSNHELEIEWAQLIKTMMPATERVEFFACGQEVNMMVHRLARAFTGRKKILRCEESSFHGWADELIVPGSTPGVICEEVKIIPAHDLDALERELATEEYAVLTTEGGGAFIAGRVPWDPEFVRAQRGLTEKYGTVWHIDEVVTGFRDAPGGWQSTIGVTPDLTSLGKTVGGGIACGALVGKAKIIDALKPKAPPERFIRHSGTWNANPLVCAAGVAACKLFLGGKPQKKANELGAYFRKKGNQALKERGISGRLYGRTAVHIYLGPIDFEPSDDTFPPTKDAAKLTTEVPDWHRLSLHLLQRGVSTMGGKFFILSSAHTKEDIDRTITILCDSLDAMIVEGSLIIPS